MEPEEYPLLKTYKITDCNILLTDCDYIPIQDDTARLYFKPSLSGVGYGFDFCAVSPICTGIDEYWDLEEVNIQVLYRGVAMFDGLRHLYMGCEGTDNYGYLYYHDLDESIEIFQALNRLIKQYCKEV